MNNKHILLVIYISYTVLANNACSFGFMTSISMTINKEKMVLGSSEAIRIESTVKSSHSSNRVICYIID